MAVSAFGKAKPKAATTPQSAAPIFVADVLKDEKGEVIYSQADIKTAINKTIEANSLAARAKSMATANRKPVLEFARRRLAELAIKNGRLPEDSPKLTTEEKGDGNFLTAAFLDKEKNMTDEQYADLAALIGEAAAKEYTRRGFEFGINCDMLDMELPLVDAEGKEVKLPLVPSFDAEGNAVYFNPKKDTETKIVPDGTDAPKGWKPLMRRQTYFDLIDSSISERFTKLYGEEQAGQLLEGLFTRKPVFKTKKGLLDRLVDFIGRATEGAAFRLAAAFEKANVEVQLKPGANKNNGKEEPLSTTDILAFLEKKGLTAECKAFCKPPQEPAAA
jgi:hypothetical protein